MGRISRRFGRRTATLSERRPSRLDQSKQQGSCFCIEILIIYEDIAVRLEVEVIAPDAEILQWQIRVRPDAEGPSKRNPHVHATGKRREWVRLNLLRPEPAKQLVSPHVGPARTGQPLIANDGSYFVVLKPRSEDVGRAVAGGTRNQRGPSPVPAADRIDRINIRDREAPGKDGAGSHRKVDRSLPLSKEIRLGQQRGRHRAAYLQELGLNPPVGEELQEMLSCEDDATPLQISMRYLQQEAAATTGKLRGLPNLDAALRV